MEVLRALVIYVDRIVVVGIAPVEVGVGVPQVIKSTSGWYDPLVVAGRSNTAILNPARAPPSTSEVLSREPLRSLDRGNALVPACGGLPGAGSSQTECLIGTLISYRSR